MSVLARGTAEPSSVEGVAPHHDFHLWAVQQASLIRNRQYDRVDWLNVAEEIESVGNNDLRSLRSNVEVVLLHILKWDHQPSKRSRSWALSIKEHRSRIQSDLKDSPSLATRWDDISSSAYDAARYRAARETRLPLKIFSDRRPYDRATILDVDFSLEDL